MRKCKKENIGKKIMNKFRGNEMKGSKALETRK